MMQGWEKSRELMHYLYYKMRFYHVVSIWGSPESPQLSISIMRLLATFYIATDAVLTGDYANKGLTDEELQWDLPFLLAKHGKLTALNLSGNVLSDKTLAKIAEKLSYSPLQSLDLSGNKLNEAAQRSLFKIVQAPLKTLSLKGCELSSQTVEDIIRALSRNSSLVELNIENNSLTEEQDRNIQEYLTRNRMFAMFNQHKHGTVLDFQAKVLTQMELGCLGEYINQDRWFSLTSRIKEIKMPVIAEEEDNNVRGYALRQLIDGLKHNDTITSLTTYYKSDQQEAENSIRERLMLNKAYQKLKWKPEKGIIQAFLSWAGISMAFRLPLFPTIMGGLFLNFLGRFQYNNVLRQAKNSDFSLPENIAYVERGKAAVYEWGAYLDPRSYTPMAKLAYTIERKGLNEKEGITEGCFKNIKIR